MKHARFLAVCLVALPSLGTAAELVLTEDGSALAPIVLFPDAPPRTRDAAAA